MAKWRISDNARTDRRAHRYRGDRNALSERPAFRARGLAAVAVCAGLLPAIGAVSGCSAKKNDNVAQERRAMRDVWPMRAAETFARFLPAIPGDFDAIAVASYGSSARAAEHFKSYGFFQKNDVEQTFSDLGEHYRLDPSRLEYYFANGMNTESGFVIGRRNGEFFAIFAVDEREKFRQWIDTVTNEEFGRPTYRDANCGDKKCIAIDVMDREFACFAFDDSGCAVLSAKIPNHPAKRSVCDALTDIAARKFLPMPDNAAQSAAAALGDAPIGFFAAPESVLRAIPGGAQIAPAVGEYVRYFALGADLQADFAKADITLLWQENKKIGDAPVGSLIASLPQGNRSIGSQYLATQPSAHIAANIDGAQAEAIVLPFLDAKTRKLYDDVKGKLTQRLFKIDVSDQVIRNIGAVMALWYGNNLKKVPAVGIAMKSPEKSDAFFSKLNILKRAISSDSVAVENENGVLRASMGNARAAYAGGLLSFAVGDGDYDAIARVYGRSADAHDGAGSEKTDGLMRDSAEDAPGGGDAQIPLIEGRFDLALLSDYFDPNAKPVFRTATARSSQNDRQLTISVRLER